MTIAFWIVAGLTALAFFAAGLMKLTRPRTALADSGMAWAADFADGPVKLIGVAEVLGAIGLIAPALTDIAPILSPVAGIALAVLMLGAVVVHVRRHEPPAAPAALALLGIASAVLGFISL